MSEDHGTIGESKHEWEDDTDDGSDSISHSDNEMMVIDVNSVSKSMAKLICTRDVYFQDLQCFLPTPVRQLFHFDSIKAECLKMYEEEKAKIKQTFRNLDGQISLCADTLRCEKAGVYICVTAYFIDDGWKLRRCVLNFRQICHSFDADDFLDGVVRNSLSEWNIGNKISTFTVEDTRYYDEGVAIVRDFIKEKKKLQLNGQLFRVYCCAETFKLMVQDAFEEIPHIIHKVEKLMCSGRSHPMWNHRYSTLKDALELQFKENYFAKDEYNQYFKRPSADEWKKVESTCKVLETIYNIANVLFKTKHPTANIYLHNFRELRDALILDSTCSDSFISAMAKKMLQRFEKYWKDMFLVLAIATVMDPRCKMKYIEFSSLKYEGNDGNSEVTTVLDAIQSLYNDYVTRVPERENSVSDSASSESEEEFSRRDKQKCQKTIAGCNWLSEYHQFTESVKQPPKSELDLYLEEPVLPWSDDFDILSWWRKASPRYPTISLMARDFLGVPVSILTSGDAYDTTEREVDPRLISSGPDLMKTLMCTRNWFQKR